MKMLGAPSYGQHVSATYNPKDSWYLKSHGNENA